ITHRIGTAKAIIANCDAKKATFDVAWGVESQFDIGSGGTITTGAAFRASLNNSGTFSTSYAYLVETANTSYNWDYGLYMTDGQADTGIHIGTCETVGINIASAVAITINSTIVTAWAYPFSVKSTFATAVSEHGYATGRFRFTLSAATVVSGTAQCQAMRVSLEIAGGSTTTLSSSGIFAAINARYYTDNVNGITASGGIHCALAAQMLAGENYTLSGGIALAVPIL
ncbi:unnamed protein product, partial [marine sediment metagenome]